MKIYISADAFKMAAYLVSVYPVKSIERMLIYKIQHMAAQIRPETAANLAFWSQVLARAQGLQLDAEESARLREEMPDVIAHGLVKMDLVSRVKKAA